MNMKHFILASLISVALVALVFTPLSKQQGETYDPWIDYNENGIVDADDLSTLAQTYGSTGDPTKNVNVTNWPEGLVGGTAPARGSITTILDSSASAFPPPYDILWLGVDSNSSAVTGIGGKTVRFVSGSISGGGTQWAQSWVEHKPSSISERPASGWVEARDEYGTVIASISLPLTQPVQISNVDSFTVTVSVPYSIGNFDGGLARQAFAVAGVTYEVLD